MAKTKAYPGHIERRGQTHRVRFSIGGRRYRLTAPTSDRRQAERFARTAYERLRDEHKRRALAGIVEGKRFSDLLDLFESIIAEEKCAGTIRSYGDSLRPIGAYFVGVLGDKLPLEKVRAAHIEDYVRWRRTHPMNGSRHKAQRIAVSARTLNKDRAVLHRLFVVAERRDWVQRNPVARTETVKVDPREWRILSEEEYERLLASCADNPTLSLYVLLLGETGMRCDSEALHLRWDDVEFEGRYVRVVSGREGHRTKTGQSREIRMSARLVSAMRDYFAAHRLGSPSPYIFHHERSGERVQMLRRSFKSAAKRAKLPVSFRQHDLRHRWVTVRADAGDPIQDVQYEAGHAQITTTMLYYKQSPVHLRRPLVETPAAQAAEVTATFAAC